MAAWTWVITRNDKVSVTRDQEEAWRLGRRQGAVVVAIPVIDLPVVEKNNAVVDSVSVAAELAEPRRLVW